MKNPFTVGGSLPNHAETYLIRAADEQIFEALVQGQYCYVLNSRQTGKSSLGLATSHRLFEKGICTIWVDLSLQDTTSPEADPWYLNLVDAINFSIGLDLEIDPWWEQFPHRSGLNRLQKYIETVLLQHITQPIVIFIDEIDTVLSLPFPIDDFFALLRSLYNLRAINSHYQNLTFCLMGVASPNDLIQNTNRTPFNIGKRITLAGFSLEETAPLQKYFEPHIQHPNELLQEILDWTGGQPFLTQKLCALIYDAIQQKQFSSVDNLVQSQILNRWEVHDDPQHLHTIQKRLVQNDRLKSRRLGLLEILHQQGTIPATGSAAEVSLLLSGIAIEQDKEMKLFNPIYREIFSLNWLQRELAHFRPYQDAIATWLDSEQKSTQSLLNPEQLRIAQAWANDKILSDLDYLFINASQEAARLKANQSEENAILNYQKSKKILGYSIFFSGIILVGATVISIIAAHNFQAINIRDTLNQGSNRAMREFEAQREVDALLIALETGFQLKNNITPSTQLHHYPSITPIRTLNTIRDHIREYRLPHAGPILDARFSPDGQQIITGSSDQTARLWKRNGDLIQTFKGHQQKITAVGFRADGTQVITGSADSTAKLWSLNGRLEATLHYPKRVQSVSISPDDRYLLTSSIGKAFWIKELPDPSVQRFAGHDQRIRHASFSPSGNLVLTVSDDKAGVLWNLEGEKVQTFLGHQGIVTHGAFSKDGQKILTSSSDRTAILWDLKGNPLHHFKGHYGWVVGGDISPDGESVLTASRDRSVKHWSITGTLLGEYIGFRGRLYHAEFSPNGKQILTVSHDHYANLWDIDRSPNNQILETDAPIRMVNFHPQGQTLLLTANDDVVQLITPTGEIRQKISGHTGSVWTARFNPNGTKFITAASDKTAHLWDSTGKLQQTLQGHQDTVFDAVFSPDETLILTGSRDKTARLWTLKGELKQVLSGHQDAIRAVQFSPDGQKLATASSDHSVRLWNLKGQLLQKFERHTAPVRSVVFSLEGDRILTASDDQTAKLWSLDGQVIQEFIGHGDRVRSAYFSPNGEQIVTASNDRTARIWDLKGNELQVLKAHTGAVQFATFDPQGQQVITVSDDRTARIWEIRTLESLLTWGCDRVRGYLASNVYAKPKHLKMCSIHTEGSA